MSPPQLPPLQGDKVWYEDVSVLVQRWTEFYPRPDHTTEERVNALVRLTLYATLAAWAYNRQPRTLVFGAGVIALVSFAFSSRKEMLPSSSGMAVAGRLLAGPGTCTPPTRDNPFANVLLTDLGKPSRPPACAYDAVKDDVKANFNAGLVRNASDIYERENSQHQFYTMPVTTTIPDTAAFSNFLYGGMRSCKTDAAACPTRLF